MPKEAYFNFTRLCSNLFYIMMLLGRGGGLLGNVLLFFFNVFRYLVLLFELLAL